MPRIRAPGERNRTSRAHQRKSLEPTPFIEVWREQTPVGRYGSTDLITPGMKGRSVTPGSRPACFSSVVT